ncbi:MAG: hypothetical protein D6815_04490, partial [Candidatus Dadabacteria bacterium]
MPIRAHSISRVLCLVVFVLAPMRAQAQTVSTGDGLSISLSPEGLVTSVRIDGHELLGAPAPILAVRDLSAAASVVAPNLVANGSFETGDAGGGAAGWSVYQPIHAAVSVVTGVSYEGSRSVLFETNPASHADGSAAYVSDPISVVPGTRYRLWGWMRARKGYLATRQTAPAWQLHDYPNGFTENVKVSGLYVAWYADPAGLEDPFDLDLVAPAHTNARAWKRIGGEVVAPPGAASARVVVVAKLLDGKHEDDAFWLDDVRMIEAPETDVAAVGSVGLDGGDLLLTGTIPGAALAVTLRLHGAPDRIEIEGAITDETSAERAFEVALRLPVALQGYRWWDDIYSARTVVAGQRYEHTVSSVVTGMLPQSLYPLALLEDGTRALAAAVPLDLPVVSSFAYTQDGTFETRYRLGISPFATRLGGRATFRAYLYRADPAWAMRSGFDKFVSFHPEWFESARDPFRFRGGEQGQFASAGSCLPGCEGPCEQCCTGARLVACYDGQGIAAAQYTAPEGPMKVGPAAAPPPAYDDILLLLGSPPTPADEERYPALAASMVVDGNGDFVLKHVTNPEWAPNDWEANWVLNMDPEIAGGYAEWTRTARIDGALAATQAIGAELDAVQFDNFMSAPAVDLDPAHLALADSPLTYDPNTYRPGVHTMAATLEYLAWLRDALDSTNHSQVILSANTWGIATLNFLVPLLDAMGNETRGQGATNWSDELLAYRRTMAGRKPLTSPWQRAGVSVGEARAYANETLFYGMYPTRAAHGADWEPGAEELIEEAAELVSRFHQLGWRAVTRARTDQANVRVERFGAGLASREDSVYLSVQNRDPVARAFTVTVEAAALGLGGSAVVVKELRAGATIPYTTDGQALVLADSLGPQETHVIRLMAPGCAPAGVSVLKLTLRGGGADRLRAKGEFAPVAGD